MLLKAWKGRGEEAKKYMETKELCQNNENEAKKWLKTKHITLLSDANYARLAHRLAPIGPQKEQKTPDFAKTNRGFQAAGRGLISDTMSATPATGIWHGGCDLRIMMMSA